MVDLHHADARALPLADKSVHMCVTSPPYWGLRNYGLGEWQGGDAECNHALRQNPAYSSTLDGGRRNTNHVNEGWVGGVCGHCGATQQNPGIGLEPTLGEWVQNIVEVGREIWRVLRDDGTLWLNLGDAYAGSPPGRSTSQTSGLNGIESAQYQNTIANYTSHSKTSNVRGAGLPSKNLIGQPWRVAFALQDQGWILRSAIVWHKCLSGGTRIYAKTQKGEMPMTIREMARLDPSTVKLWTGEKWAQLRSILETQHDDAIEVRFRNGQSVGCSPEHRWPTGKGIKIAQDLMLGDVVPNASLPDTGKTVSGVPNSVAFVIGLYIAEGSRGKKGRQINFSLNVKEAELTDRIREAAEYYGGHCSVHDYGNTRSVNVYSRVLAGILDTYVVGSDSHHKHLTSDAWAMSNLWLRSLMDGYLAGDGSLQGTRWRLGFTANEAWANDLRTLAARLSASVHLKWAMHLETTTGKRHKGFRGDWRFDPTQRRKPDGEIVGIQRSKGRRFFSIAIDEPHVFTLASGLQTMNSNPMPESVTDRPTSAYEMIFLLAKQGKYFYDADAIRQPSITNDTRRPYGSEGAWQMDGRPEEQRHGGEQRKTKMPDGWDTGSGAHGTIHRNGREPGARSTDKQRGHSRRHDGFNDCWDAMPKEEQQANGANARNVWTIATQGRSEVHFASFPDEVPRRAILAGTSERGVCADCGAPWWHPKDEVKGWILNEWIPTCDCNAATVPATVLDCFIGRGTTAIVAQQLGRRAVGVDLNLEYLEMSRKNLEAVTLPMQLGS